MSALYAEGCTSEPFCVHGARYMGSTAGTQQLILLLQAKHGWRVWGADKGSLED